MNTGGMVATTAAATAAAAAARKRRLEEEKMTPYKKEDLDGGWEFKILRSSMEAFKKPEQLQHILEDEARAGWTLVEKFDDARIRLKRPEDAKERDPSLDFDPYRTSVPGEASRMLKGLVVFGVISILTVAVVWYVVTLVN